MGLPADAGLYDSGEDAAAIVVERGAVHLSRSQRTTRHAHHAWKVHVGIDAPVWLESSELRVGPRDGARVLVVPPDFEHTTGAVGWSAALFVEPGTRGTPAMGDKRPFVLHGSAARRVVDACRESQASARPETRALVDEVVRHTVPLTRERLDARVARALERLARVPGTPLTDLARGVGLSVDRLTHLVSLQTGIPPRRHAVWQRLLALLSRGPLPGNLASVAVDAGFTDHAHMTRTFRRFLGRAPSEFKAPPHVIAPWSAALRST
jgi:AraC-like DNA-binding protein